MLPHPWVTGNKFSKPSNLRCSSHTSSLQNKYLIYTQKHNMRCYSTTIEYHQKPAKSHSQSTMITQGNCITKPLALCPQRLKLRIFDNYGVVPKHCQLWLTLPEVAQGKMIHKYAETKCPTWKLILWAAKNQRRLYGKQHVAMQSIVVHKSNRNKVATVTPN